MSLSLAEKEATINYDEERGTWKIFCASGKVRTKMHKAGFEPYKTDVEGNTYYEVDYEQVSFRQKSKPREWTDEQREAAAERLRNARQKRTEVLESET